MYRLVHMAAARAIQLADGAPRLVETPQDMKVTTVAMLEIAQEKVRGASGGKAPKAEKAKKEEA